MPNHIVINEIGHSGQEKVNGYDWIELYNPTAQDINLEGYCFLKGTKTYIFPAIKVPAGGYKVIFCSGTGQGGVYAPFAISKGDVISIKDKNGTVIEQVQIELKGSQTHLGRYPDGGDWKEISRYLTTPNESKIYLDGVYHYYDEQIRNAIVVNGVLIDRLFFATTQIVFSFLILLICSIVGFM